jgi:hypothetical protein
MGQASRYYISVLVQHLQTGPRYVHTTELRVDRQYCEARSRVIAPKLCCVTALTAGSASVDSSLVNMRISAYARLLRAETVRYIVSFVGAVTSSRLESIRIENSVSATYAIASMESSKIQTFQAQKVNRSVLLNVLGNRLHD